LVIHPSHLWGKNPLPQESFAEANILVMHPLSLWERALPAMAAERLVELHGALPR
jgi:hypothetical protein